MKITENTENSILTGFPVSLSISGNIEPTIVIINTNGTGVHAKAITAIDKATAVATPKEICALKLAKI